MTTRKIMVVPCLVNRAFETVGPSRRRPDAQLGTGAAHGVAVDAGAAQEDRLAPARRLVGRLGRGRELPAHPGVELLARLGQHVDAHPGVLGATVLHAGAVVATGPAHL